MAGKYFVYLYRTNSGTPKYVGYGTQVDRALSHPGRSHNPKLRAWLERNQFDLNVAGPYESAREAKCVEAALISSLSPEFNVAPGEGPRFRPIGVPAKLEERLSQPELSLRQLGRRTGGALLVYLSPGDFLKDGRRKFDPADPNDSVILHDMEGYWALHQLRKQWAAKPKQSPKVLLGIYGRNIKHRFVAGAAEIDAEHWLDDDLRSPRSGRWKVPILDRSTIDACELRGVRVKDVRFTNFTSGLFIWVDSSGRIRHPQ